jgi:elongation factor P
MSLVLRIASLALVLASSCFAFVPIAPPRLHSALSVAIDTSDIKNGLTIELDGEPYKVLSFSVMKQARGAAKTTIKLKNLMRGTTLENTYRSGEKFETALIEKRNVQYTYQEGVSNITVHDIHYMCIYINVYLQRDGWERWSVG